MFLTRIERRILKELNNGSFIANWEVICNKFSTNQVRAAITALEDKGYMTCNFAGNVPFFVELHLNGYAYKEIGHKKLLEFFLKSFLTPIVVAFVTTLITTKFF